jgi:D-alanine-D-alanine ligase
MRIGLAYNEKPNRALGSLDDPPSISDAYVEWDDPSTIEAVERALSLFGSVVRLEADAGFPQQLALTRPDLVFNMAEGWRGVNRESHVPAICEYLGIPYSGSDPLTLGLALHKGRAKEVLAYRGVPTAPFIVVERPHDLDRMDLRFPLFVKPVAEGSSKGIFADSCCHDATQLRERVLFLLEAYAQPALVESYLPGPEFTVAILGNGAEARCLPVVGLDFAALPDGAAPVYGYEAKWVWDTTERPLAIFQCPAQVPAALTREIERVALDAYHALGCRDWCRVDVRVDRFAVPNVVELNPLPGIIPDPAMNSCFPKAARTAGLSYEGLIQEVARIAWRRITGREVDGMTADAADRAAARPAPARYPRHDAAPTGVTT